LFGGTVVDWWWLQSGGEASLVTKVVDVVNGTEPSQSLRDPPVITISKSAVAAVYKLTYMHVKPFGTTVHLFLNFSPFPHQNILIRSAIQTFSSLVFLSGCCLQT